MIPKQILKIILRNNKRQQIGLLSNLRNILSNVETLNLCGGLHRHSLANDRTSWRREPVVAAVPTILVPNKPQRCCGGAHPGGLFQSTRRRVGNKEVRFGVDERRCQRIDEINRRSRNSSHCSLTILFVCVVVVDLLALLAASLFL